MLIIDPCSNGVDVWFRNQVQHVHGKTYEEIVDAIYDFVMNTECEKTYQWCVPYIDSCSPMATPYLDLFHQRGIRYVEVKGGKILTFR